MKKIILTLFVTLLIAHASRAQVTLDSTNLPIVAIYTYFTPIPDTPKIRAFMGIIDNGYNVMNHVTDTNFAYLGHIGIEQRGSISQFWWYWQKSYGIETRDSLGNDSSAIILGMPKESDWVLYSPYDDRTLMRNIITYDLSRQMGYWAPRTKYCEVLLNDFLFWNYKGVYVMMEKIKRDNNRVDIAKLDADDNAGDSLTGGYIIAVDSNINAPDAGFFSIFQPQVFYAYKYPKGEDITPQQATYIKAYMDTFEFVMALPGFDDPISGYRKYAVDTTFMDFFIIQELSKNVDCYKRSAYLHKDKNSNGGRLRAGPVWDFNAAWHNTAICAAYHADTGWAITQSCFANAAFPVPWWWGRFFQDTVFVNSLKCRWLQYRSTFLNTAYIFHQLDSMTVYVAQGQVREYMQWNFTENFQAESDTLKAWIARRIAWMDANMPGNCTGVGITEGVETEKFFSVYPNPNSGEFTVKNLRALHYEIEIYNPLGEIIFARKSNSINENISLDVPSGIYLLKIKSGDAFTTIKIMNVR